MRIQAPVEQTEVAETPDHDLEVRFSLVEYGYQVDFVLAGQEALSICRDFKGSYQIKQIIAEIVELFPDFMRQVDNALLSKQDGALEQDGGAR